MGEKNDSGRVLRTPRGIVTTVERAVYLSPEAVVTSVSGVEDEDNPAVVGTSEMEETGEDSRILAPFFSAARARASVTVWKPPSGAAFVPS